MTPSLTEDIERRHVCAALDVDVAGHRVSLLKPRSIDALIDAEDFSRDERLPYWAELWPASRVLADAVARERGAGRTCLELGCGLGLVTIAAMMAGFHTTATDYYADALAFTRTNAVRCVGYAPLTRLADWRRMPADLGTFERVLAADVLYERPYAALMASAIARVLAAGGVATVADPGRAAAGTFSSACAALGLEAAESSVHEVPDGAVIHRVRVFEVVRR